MMVRASVTMPTVEATSTAIEALSLGDEPARVVKLLSAGEAQRLTQQIKITASSVRNGLFKLRNLIDEAKRSNAWNVLGFASWTAYLVDALGDEPMRVSRDERLELVGFLAGEGLSTRAIAPIVGASVGTVHADIASGVQNRTPERPSEAPTHSTLPTTPAKPVGGVSGAPVAAVTGLDGKRYNRPVRVEPTREQVAERERVEAERAASQEWAAWRDLYSGIVRAANVLADYHTHNAAKLMAHLESGMLTPPEERDFTVERMRAAVETLTNLIAWKEAGK